MKKKYKNSIYTAISLLILALLFFLGTSAFNFFTQSYSPEGDFVKWTSPDETANYIFAKLYGQEGRISINEDYNLRFSDVMHPRSFRSDHGVLKPVSFIGIILLYGKIVSLSSYKLLPFFTPAIAAIAIVFYYFLAKELFDKKIALVSAVILSFFPPFIYYSARSMFHNVPFVALLIIAVYFLMKAFSPKKKQKFFDFSFPFSSLKIAFLAVLAGIFLGGAIIMRSSELLWLLPSLALAWLCNIKKTNFLNLPLIFSGLALVLIPFFYHNQILYGSISFAGYPEMNQSIAEIISAGSGGIAGEGEKNFFLTLRDNVFRFGFHERFSLEMFNRYFVQMFPLLFGASFLGLILFLVNYKKLKYKQIVFLFCVFLFSGFLTLYYGSWEFHDNPDPDQFTIGNSYTRYWLPVYLGLLPWASLFLVHSARLARKIFNLRYLEEQSQKFFSIKLRGNLFEIFVISIFLFVYILSSLNFVIMGSEEGLLQTAFRQKASQEEYKRLLELTENNSVLITKYHDKLIFPERKVIVGLFDDPGMNNLYSALSRDLPVYYYNFTFPQKDFDYLNERRLKEAGINISLVEEINENFSLYKISLNENL